ncbi:MAG: cytochrome c oxidase subunit II [bacterium]
MTAARRRPIAAICLALAGCESPQSALSPAGRDAEQVATLFWVMLAGAAVVWLAVMGAALYAVVRGGREHAERSARLFIVGGGIVFPTVVLTVLLVFGLRLLPGMLDLGPEPPVAVVSGEQWWWRVTYQHDGGELAAANELRLPLGRRSAVAVTSPDVIHALWVPALGGKVDAIPGRQNHLAFEPTREGTYRGLCAEYCGLSHALMNLDVVVMRPDAYAAWLAAEAAPAKPPADDITRRGADAFAAHGCGACHAIRGTAANGTLGPDLTHVGGRVRIGGVLPNTVDGFRDWLTHPEHHKPGVHMPSFHMLPPAELDALARYLDELH